MRCAFRHSQADFPLMQRKAFKVLMQVQNHFKKFSVKTEGHAHCIPIFTQKRDNCQQKGSIKCFFCCFQMDPLSDTVGP